MRVTTLLRSLLGLEGTRVLDVNFDEEGLVVDVAPTWRQGRCSECGQRCPGYDRADGRLWRHLDLAGMTLRLRYDTRRVDCPRCGVKVEQVPWAETLVVHATVRGSSRVPRPALRQDDGQRHDASGLGHRRTRR